MMNEEYWREIRKMHQSQMSFHISEAMVGAYHRWGGAEAAKTGMVNVEGKMVEAVIDVLTNNDWLNDAGISALTPPKLRGIDISEDHNFDAGEDR